MHGVYTATELEPTAIFGEQRSFPGRALFIFMVGAYGLNKSLLLRRLAHAR